MWYRDQDKDLTTAEATYRRAHPELFPDANGH
jgi:hypothetical protein